MSANLLPQTYLERHVQQQQEVQEWHGIQIRARHDQELLPYPDDDDDGSFGGDGEDDTTMLPHPHHPMFLLRRLHAVENQVDAIPMYSH